VKRARTFFPYSPATIWEPTINNIIRCLYRHNCDSRKGRVRGPRLGARPQSIPCTVLLAQDRGERRIVGYAAGVAQAMPDDAQIDPGEAIAALRRELDARTAERDGRCPRELDG